MAASSNDCEIAGSMLPSERFVLITFTHSSIYYIWWCTLNLNLDYKLQKIGTLLSRGDNDKWSWRCPLESANHSSGRVGGIMFARELSYRIRMFYTSRINGFKGMSTCLLDPLRVKKTKQFCYSREGRKTICKI